MNINTFLWYLYLYKDVNLKSYRHTKTPKNSPQKQTRLQQPGKTNFRVDKNCNIVHITQAWNTENTTTINHLFNQQSVHLKECHETAATAIYEI